MWDRTFTDTFRRPGLRIAALALTGVALGSPAAAQLDPLLPYKRVPPNVIVIVDTSFRRLDDGQGNDYDPKVYPNAGDAVASALNVPSTAALLERTVESPAARSSSVRPTPYEAENEHRRSLAHAEREIDADAESLAAADAPPEAFE